LVQAGKPVDAVIESLLPLLDSEDIIIDGGNEWYQNTERRQKAVWEAKKIFYMGMGVSGGEEGARYGPSLMPGGEYKAYQHVEPILKKIAAQVDDGPCVTYIGAGGAGNYVKMIHNGIEYGDMQLIAESYDILKNVGGLNNEELAQTFTQYNQTELESFLIEITAKIFAKKDEDGKTYIVDTILDKTGSKGTGKWTVQEAAEKGVPVPTMSSALDARYISALLDQRRQASKILRGPNNEDVIKSTNKQELIRQVRYALYAAKICSYTQGMNLIKTAGEVHNWNLNLGEISRIWKGGCIIRAKFLDRIKKAYDKNSKLESLLLDADFAGEMNERQGALREVIILSIKAGTTTPGFSASLGYYDSYRRDRLPANLTQAQRDFFGAHTYQSVDKAGWYHTEWSKPNGKTEKTSD
jgi:6-phosphogluconate dehydrogenase